MEYKGKLYGRLGYKIYFDTGKTADDWDNLEKRIAELEDENKALSMSGVGGCQCKDGKWHDKKVGGWICSMCGVPV